jgi:MoaA/NifB/PqqE/SkfB family radical SAM enzyme
MSLDNYKTNINQIKDYTSHLQLFFQGEPFIHPDIYDMISYATSKNIYTSTSTNGHFLSTDNCTKIINSKLHRIIISIDGTTQESYEKYRVGGDLNRVKSGISNLVNEKKRLKSRTPFIIMQFIVFKNNEHQINDIKQLAKQLNVDAIKIKTAQIYNFKFGNELIPTNEEFSRYKKEGNTYVLNKKKNYKCKRVWFGLVISADNNLLPCCFDKDAKYSFNNGYINETNTITDNWHNKKLMKFRKLVWNNNNTIDICQNCTEGINQKN